MGGIFGVASKSSCILDLFFGIDYHSHLGTRRGGMAVYDKKRGFDRVIHNIENAPFRTKFDGDIGEMEGNLGIGCISDNEPQPLLVRSHLGSRALRAEPLITGISSPGKSYSERSSRISISTSSRSSSSSTISHLFMNTTM